MPILRQKYRFYINPVLTIGCRYVTMSVAESIFALIFSAKEERMRKKILKIAAFCLAVFTGTVFTGSCKYAKKKIKAEELTAVYSFSKNIGESSGDTVHGIDNFGAELLKEVVKDKKGVNTLVSPLSAAVCLAMIANGAEGETLGEFENVLGGNIFDINAFLNGIISKNDENVKLADSVWIRNGEVNIEESYLKTVKEVYNSEIYKSDFDAQTVKDVNNWCANKTDGMIPEIIERIERYDVLYAINALLFDAKWQNKYEKKNIYKRNFVSYDNVTKSVDMMHSAEDAYLDFGNAQGFLRDYLGGNYSFLGILPNEETDIYDFVGSLTGEKYYNAFKSRKSVRVNAGIPEFTFDYSANLSSQLQAMGIKKAFDRDEAEFDKMGRTADDNNLYLGYFLHKTRIELDRNGTKAAAISFGGAKGNDVASQPEETHTIILNRPFMFGIVDNSTGLPLFLGVVTNI